MSGEVEVNEFMATLSHPFKAEIEALRQIILNADSRFAERIKWNAPSFYYKVDFAAFHLRNEKFVHLIIVYPPDTTITDTTGLLEGNHKDRREAKFYNMEDVQNKKTQLEKVITDWMEITEKYELPEKKSKKK